MDVASLLNVATRAAQTAGAEIMAIYNNGDAEVERKADDSPLTLADRAAHQTIVAHLHETQLPILSEEGQHTPYEERRGWETFWLVDPLDGTKEFIKRNGEFTVNIALIHREQPVAGVVYVPAVQTTYYGLRNGGAFREAADGKAVSLHCLPADLKRSGVRVVASRSHLNDETKAFIDALSDPETVSMGSSLKFLLIAEGKADLYPRFAPTMEWDTAAAQAVVEAAGGVVLEYPVLEPLRYNKENLRNPHFLVRPA